MKKLSILFSLAFFAFVISASAQTSTASTDKETVAAEKVDCGVEVKTTKAKAKGCCMNSSKAKCESKDKTEAKKSDVSKEAEAVATEQKATAVTESK
jgi:hypothetical protein